MNKKYFIKREFCPACKSIKYRTIYSCGFLESPIKEFLKSFHSERIKYEYLGGSKFILNECRACGLIYQEEIPNIQLMNKLYDWIDTKEAFDKEVEDAGLGYYSTLAQEIVMLITYFKSTPPKLKFFDFGIGWSNWCKMVKGFGCDSYGTDLSKNKIEYAKSHGIKIITWDEIPKYKFDFINTEQVVEHVAEPLKTLCHLKKSLKPAGLIKISVPDGSDIKRRLKIMDWGARRGSRNSLVPVIPLQHINCFSRNSLIKMADKAGLKLVKIPICIQYRCNIKWKPVMKNILRPIYRNLLNRGTYLFFHQK